MNAAPRHAPRRAQAVCAFGPHVEPNPVAAAVTSVAAAARYECSDESSRDDGGGGGGGSGDDPGSDPPLQGASIDELLSSERWPSPKSGFEDERAAWAAAAAAHEPLHEMLPLRSNGDVDNATYCRLMNTTLMTAYYRDCERRPSERAA